MIKVDLDKIITKQALENHLNNILNRVEDGEELFVITKKGRPRAVLINVDYLEELTNRSVTNESEEYSDYEKFDIPKDESPHRIVTPSEIGQAKFITPEKRFGEERLGEDQLKEEVIMPVKPEPEPEKKKGKREALSDLDIADIDFDNEPSTPAIDENLAPPVPVTPVESPIQTTIQPVEEPNTIDLNNIVAPSQMSVPPESSTPSTDSGSGPA